MAIYKRGREFELGTTAQIQQVARAGLEPGSAGLRVRRAEHSATLPPGPSSVELPVRRKKERKKERKNGVQVKYKI